MSFASTNQLSAQRLMLVVNKKLPGLTIYDADTWEVLHSISSMEVSPHEAAFSHDGKYAYIPIYGSGGVGKPGTDKHTLHFVQVTSGSIIESLDTEQYKRLHGIAVGQQSGLVYLTAETAQSVLVIDAEEKRTIGAISTGSSSSHMMAVTRNESKCYVSNVRSQTIAVLDLQNRRLVRTIHTEGENQRMVLSPNERWFVTNLGPAQKVPFYKTSDEQLDFTVFIEGTPFVSKFSLDGRFLYTAGFAQESCNAAWKIDVEQKRVVAKLSQGLGFEIGALEVSPFTQSVFISDQATDCIYEIDPETWTVTNTIKTAASPDAIVFASKS